MRDRSTSRSGATDEDPLEALLDAIAEQIDRLNESLDKLADEAFIETEEGGHRVRLRVNDRFGRGGEASRAGRTEDDDPD